MTDLIGQSPADPAGATRQVSGQLQAALHRARRAAAPSDAEPLAAPDGDVVAELEQVHRELREMLDRGARA